MKFVRQAILESDAVVEKPLSVKEGKEDEEKPAEKEVAEEAPAEEKSDKE